MCKVDEMKIIIKLSVAEGTAGVGFSPSCQVTRKETSYGRWDFFLNEGSEPR